MCLYLNSIFVFTQDFVGQYRAEMFYRVIITAFGIGGIAYGYHLQSFMQTVLVLAAGFVVAALVRIIFH